VFVFVGAGHACTVLYHLTQMMGSAVTAVYPRIKVSDCLPPPSAVYPGGCSKSENMAIVSVEICLVSAEIVFRFLLPLRVPWGGDRDVLAIT